MSAETVLYDALSDAAGVGTLVSDRIYPGLLPQGKALPAIVYLRTDTEFITTIHSSTPCGSRVEMEVWGIAGTNGAAESIGDAIEVALAAALLVPFARRAEIDPETEAHSSIISCVVWP
jgi:hypothetical protein